MIGRAALIRVFIRSFYIQASWSFERMQGLGFASAMQPALQELYMDAGERLEALKRHLAFYNAHPYMASPVLGATIRLEEEAREGRRDKNAATGFKKKIMGPYGATGDAFFWASLRPFASIAALVLALFAGVWGVVALLAIYNAPHLFMRWQGLKKGLELGDGVIYYVKSLELPARGDALKKAGAFLLGAFVVMAVFSFSGQSSWPLRQSFLGCMVAGAVVGLSFLVPALMKKGIGPLRAVYVAAVPLVIYAIARLF